MASRLAEAYRTKRVLLTGHTGFKGAWLAHWLSKLGAEVFGVALEPESDDVLFVRAGVEERVGHHVADIRDLTRLREIIRDVRPDYVFHLAAQSLVRRSYEDPVGTFETNVLGTVNVLEAVRQLDECAVVVVTSDKCYENLEWQYAYREDDRMGGHDPYSASKGAAEIVSASYRRSFFADGGIRIASGRAGNVVGAGDWAADRIVPDVIRAVFAGQDVQVRNPASIRPWQHVLEPLSGYLWLGARMAAPDGARHARAYNFGPPPESCRSVGELVNTLHAALGRERAFSEDDRDAPHEAKFLRLAIDLAVAELGWKPAWGFEETLTRTAKGYERSRQAVAECVAVLDEDILAYEDAARRRGAEWAKEAGR